MGAEYLWEFCRRQSYRMCANGPKKGKRVVMYGNVSEDGIYLCGTLLIQQKIPFSKPNKRICDIKFNFVSKLCMAAFEFMRYLRFEIFIKKFIFLFHLMVIEMGILLCM